MELQTSSNQLETKDLGETKTIQNIEEIKDKYDFFIFDQYGVLLDGVRALPGAIACVQQLLQSNKKLAVLSNSPRRASAVLNRLPQYGYDVSWFEGAMTSGEACYNYLKEHFHGKKCALITYIGWRDHLEYFDGLDITITPVEEADFILCNGPDFIVEGMGDDQETPSDFKSTGITEVFDRTLEVGGARGLPLLCSNPDLKVNASGRVGTEDGAPVFWYMPGSIAKVYEEKGGDVLFFGKPHKEVLEACLPFLGSDIDRLRVIMVGDSLHHDIKGGQNAGMDTLFIAGHGVHAQEITSKPNDNNNQSEKNNHALPSFEDVFKHTQIFPTYALHSFDM